MGQTGEVTGPPLAETRWVRWIGMKIPPTARLMLKQRTLPRRLHLNGTLKVWFLTTAVDTNSIVIPILILTCFSGRKTHDRRTRTYVRIRFVQSVVSRPWPSHNPADLDCGGYSLTFADGTSNGKTLNQALQHAMYHGGQDRHPVNISRRWSGCEPGAKLVQWHMYKTS